MSPISRAEVFALSGNGTFVPTWFDPRADCASIWRLSSGNAPVVRDLVNPPVTEFSAAKDHDHEEKNVKYSNILNLFKTPQASPIPFSNQVRNAAGGYAWEVDRWTMLDRFLILGSENGTYYIGEHALTVQHAQNVIEAIKEDGERVVAHAVQISTEGRAPKNDPAIFVLALVASYGDDKSRTAAFIALPRICRTGTHLFAFTKACRGMRGWGRGMRKAVSRWYNSQSVESLVYGLVKYGSRQNWSNRDLLRLAHPKPESAEHAQLYRWVVSGQLPESSLAVFGMLRAIETLRATSDIEEAVYLIREFGIPREAVPTELLNEPLVWSALLDNMPMTAMIRNLGNMSKVRVLTERSYGTKRVVEQLGDADRLKRARVHPVGILAALVTYSKGRGIRGSGEWKPVEAINTALNEAFYESFGNVEPTGKRLLLGLDVSGSMAGTMVQGIAGLDCRRACGAMALVTASVESGAEFIAFDTDSYQVRIKPDQKLEDVVRTLEKTGGGGTDCSAPIEYARRKRIPVDAFVIYTDSETWHGNQHPAQAVVRYRKEMGIMAKLVVVAMASNRSSIAAPSDAGMLNVVGFDTAVPNLISEFIRA